MLAIVDYGVGNLFSLKSSLAKLDQEVVVSANPDVILNADRVILPGVGAFADAAAKLRKNAAVVDALCKSVATGKPLMGICLGMQLLFTKSFEYGEHEGLNFIKGEIRPIKDVIPGDLKIPHMGWNALQFAKKHSLFKYIKEGDCVYFVHSYAAFGCNESVIAQASYGALLTAAVAKDNVMGCQFHPEKSGDVGLNILRSFCEMEVKN